MPLPQEIIDLIASYLPLRDCCKISDFSTKNKLENSCYELFELWDHYAYFGELSILKWFHKNNIKGADIETMIAAIRGQHLIICKWLYEIVGIQPTESCYNFARNIETLEWLHSLGIKGNYIAMNEAARNGDLSLVRWFHQNNFGCTEDAMDDAAVEGHTEVVKFLHKYRWENNFQDALEYAAEYGNLDIVVYLMESCQGLYVEDAIRYASKYSTEEYFEICKFLEKFNFSKRALPLS